MANPNDRIVINLEDLEPEAQGPKERLNVSVDPAGPPGQGAAAFRQQPLPPPNSPNVYPASYSPAYYGQVVAPAPRYAGFWLRLGAWVIDSFVLGLLYGIIAWILKIPDKATNAIGFLLFWPVFALFESSAWQGTPGKKALGLVVTDLQGRRISFGKASGRYFGKWLSAVILGIGFLMVAFTDRKQGLHDKLAGTLVLKNNRQ